MGALRPNFQLCPSLQQILAMPLLKILSKWDVNPTNLAQPSALKSRKISWIYLFDADTLYDSLVSVIGSYMLAVQWCHLLCLSVDCC